MICLPADLKIRTVSLVRCVAVHDQILAKYPGARGIRAPQELEAAIGVQLMGYRDTFVEIGVDLAVSLAIRHPFVDGNKRTAVGAMFTFFDLNLIDFERSDPRAMARAIEQIVADPDDPLKWKKADLVAYVESLNPFRLDR